MKAQIFKQDETKPFMRGEYLATIEDIKTENKLSVSQKAFELKDYLQAVHNCTVIIKISED